MHFRTGRRDLAAALVAALTVPLLLAGPGAGASTGDRAPGPGPNDPSAATGAAPASAAPAASAPDSASDPVPEAGLVPGVSPGAEGRKPFDTPDQRLAPAPFGPQPHQNGHLGRTPTGKHAAQGVIEYVPRGEAETPRSQAPRCTSSTGPYQRQAERYLRLPEDGRQSPRDCAAIQRYQTEHAIRPASGFAGPSTWRVMQLESARKNAHRLKGCPARPGRVACVDLKRQMMWVRDGQRIVYAPVPVRTGRAGYRTRTGWFRVYWRHRDHWSSLYHSAMPFSQFFSGGQAFHGIYADIYSPPGSYGCVNLRYKDAERLWATLRKGDRVYVWGRRPGT
ncbi:L,D-transpeptidase [Streptomyces sp. NPDC048172]|uniref:L,D-transpeptidase n=1 Tax=Streptomyces sp. NPDC048172 TaxID=3365505 RepID=UPI00371DAB27